MSTPSLPIIPLVELENGHWNLNDPEMRSRTLDLLHEGRKLIGKHRLPLLEHLSRAWAQRSNNPHLEEIRELCRDLPTGLWFMNFCYEWGCTTRVGTDPTSNLPILVRTLDWPFNGIGRNLVVAHHINQAGADFYNMAWPGYTGVVTAMAPSRFAAAINQAPMRKSTPVHALNWLAARPRVWRRSHLPPAHLLRQVFDQAPDFKSAVKMLCETPVAIPVIYSIAGIRPGETCIIERLENDYHLIEGGNATGNHWQAYDFPATPRGDNSHDRRSLLARQDWSDLQGFRWVQEPVLNPDTRLAVETCAASTTLRVQGYESDGPATGVFELAKLEAKSDIPVA